MGGLAGYLGGVLPAERVNHVLQGMADAIQSRGPDDSDCWADVDNRIGFGHRRLSIVDLSAAGHQSMASLSGRYLIAYNGEIYDHPAAAQLHRRALLDLREHLEALAEQHAARGAGSSRAPDQHVLVGARGCPGRCRQPVCRVRARAIENQAALAVCNRVGSGEPDLRYCGGSVVLAPDGTVMADARSDECVVVGSLNRELVASVRREMPVLPLRAPALDWGNHS